MNDTDTQAGIIPQANVSQPLPSVQFQEAFDTAREMLKCGGLLISSPQDSNDTGECDIRTLIQIDGDIITSVKKTSLRDDELIRTHFYRVSKVSAELDKLRSYFKNILMLAGSLSTIWVVIVPIIKTIIKIFQKEQIDLMVFIGQVTPHPAVPVFFMIFYYGRKWVLRWMLALIRPKFSEWSPSPFPNEPMRLY